MTNPTLLDEVNRYREARNQRLRSPEGWLSLVERHVLDEGENEVGIGTATFRDGEVRVTFKPGVVATRDGAPISEHVWPKDAAGPGPYFVVNGVRWELLRQAPKAALRARDPNSPHLAAFEGLDFFPVDERFRVTAKLVPAPHDTITMMTGLGVEQHNKCPGTLSFELLGVPCRIDPVIEDDSPNQLFLIFRDATSGKSTYGAGRFMYTPLPGGNGEVVLDFNKAFNPPCALTAFASCPVAPPQNRLSVAIEAGEKTPKDAH